MNFENFENFENRKDPRWKEGDGAPLAGRQRPACFLLRVYKIRDLLTMFAPTGTCARAPRPCTPVTHKRRAPRRGGPFRRRRPSPRDPAEIFYSPAIFTTRYINHRPVAPAGPLQPPPPLISPPRRYPRRYTLVTSGLNHDFGAGCATTRSSCHIFGKFGEKERF